MRMQDALAGALSRAVYARPTGCPTQYLYRYVQLPGSGGDVIECIGVDRFGMQRSGFWRSITRRELEADWIVCDKAGRELPAEDVAPRMTLSDVSL